MSGNKLNIVDMFCGGGGESTGLIEAAHDYNFEVNMSAINHWERAKERYAIVGTDNYGIELGFRMLQPNELAAATGFPAEYEFTGTKVEVVKQIGNAVPPNFAKALFSQILKEMVS